MKITIPYCTPAMLEALKKIHQEGRCTLTNARIVQTLRARGWINKDGSITSKGIAFLNGR